MKKLSMFLCIVIMFFGIVGCPPKDDPAPKATTSSVVTKPNVGGPSPVVAVLGYFSRSGTTALNIQKVNATGTLNANSDLTLITPACPSGYVITGGGCHTYSYGNFFINGTRQFGAEQRWACDFRNFGTYGVGVEVHGICTRVPGR
jgi:hypothetical protein